jgi:hypothetical protein
MLKAIVMFAFHDPQHEEGGYSVFVKNGDKTEIHKIFFKYPWSGRDESLDHADIKKKLEEIYNQPIEIIIGDDITEYHRINRRVD